MCVFADGCVVQVKGAACSTGRTPNVAEVSTRVKGGVEQLCGLGMGLMREMYFLSVEQQ